MPARTAIAIDLGRRYLRVVLAERTGDDVTVRSIVAADRPPAIDAEDPEALGAWVGERLVEAGVPRGKVTVALAREHVVIKRLRLPTIEADELPDMTRLALQRDLPFDPDGAVVDFVTLHRGETATTILAVAAPAAIVERTRRLLRAAGLVVDRMSLRSMGCAAIVASREDQVAGRVLVIDITREGVELTVVAGGTVCFSRAAAIPATDDAEVLADAIVTETRRTWVSYRISDGAEDVDRIVTMGPPAVAGTVAERAGAMLRVVSVPLDEHPRVRGDVEDLARVWPLAGMLLAPQLGVETIDLASPRLPPDVAGRRRRWALAGAGLVVVGLLAIWTAGRLSLESLRADLEAAERRAEALDDRYATYQRDQLQLFHLERWGVVRVDWIEHVGHLATLLPPPRELVLDGINGTLEVGPVRYDRRAADDKWSVESGISIVLDGEAADRATADGLRAALVESDLYRQSSAGADARGGNRLPFGFAYRLRSTEAAPAGAGATEDPPAARGEEGSP